MQKYKPNDKVEKFEVCVDVECWDFMRHMVNKAYPNEASGFARVTRVGGQLWVHDPVFPLQTGSGGSTVMDPEAADEALEKMGLLSQSPCYEMLCWWHSHPSSLFWSATDEKQIKDYATWGGLVSIELNSKGEAIYRADMLAGSPTFRESGDTSGNAVMVPLSLGGFGIGTFEREQGTIDAWDKLFDEHFVEEKIEVKSSGKLVSYQAGGGGGYGGHYPGGWWDNYDNKWRSWDDFDDKPKAKIETTSSQVPEVQSLAKGVRMVIEYVEKHGVNDAKAAAYIMTDTGEMIEFWCDGLLTVTPAVGGEMKYTSLGRAFAMVHGMVGETNHKYVSDLTEELEDAVEAAEAKATAKEVTG